MRKILFISFCHAFCIAQAGDVKYPVSTISEELKANANAIVRNDVTVYQIFSRNKASAHSNYVVTILNNKAESYAHLVLPYDKMSSVKDLTGFVYDANGKLLKKLKKTEVADQSSYDGLFSDNRIKVIDLSQAAYPYTVEFDWEMEYKFLYSIGGTAILPAEKVSVQFSEYQLIYPPNLKPRIKTRNLAAAEPRIEKTSDGQESMKWTFENVKAVLFEPLGPHLLPSIIAAPSIFEYDGFVGDMSTWEEFGRWNLLLNKDRDQLPEATKQKIRDLTKNLETIEQKTKALYEYLQSKTRYVSIQEGIGGLQPFPASTVDETGYGDCKALSNYMVALLKVAGVKGYYTRVRSGADEPELMTDFSSHQTNHVIVSVPNGADTIWLECTSQTNPFGYQGTFTGGRKALMITETGGKLVNTIRYLAEQNVQKNSADVFVEKSGNAKARITSVYSGLQYENGGLDFVVNYQEDLQRKWLQNNTDIPSFDINSFSMTNRKTKIPSAVVNLDLTLSRFATVSGKRLFITPNLLNRVKYVPEKIDNRKTSVILEGIVGIDLDSIRYHLPNEIYPEYLPDPVKIASKFGTYESSFQMEQGSVLYIRRRTFHKGVFPPESYQELVDYYKKISKADNIKLVFLNKT